MSLRSLVPRLRLVAADPTARNTLWMFLAQGLRLAVQGVYFIIIARQLGVGQYGAFISVAALVSVISPFAGLGTGSLLVKLTARDPSRFREYWGSALLLTLASGVPAVLLALFLSQIILGGKVPLMLVLLIACADLLFGRLFETSGQAFQAVQSLKETAQLNMLFSILRLLAALVMSGSMDQPGVVIWGVLYFASIVLSSGVGFVLVTRRLGRPIFNLARLRADAAEGFYFAIGTSAYTIYNDIDKTILGRYGTLGAAGVYGAAYRLIDISFVPVRSLLYATYAKFFQHGSTGIKGSLSFARKVLPLAGAYGLLVGLGLALGAPIIPLVLGRAYTDTASAVRWLAVIPLLKGFQFFGADTLTGAGHQKIRSLIQLVVALLNIGLNLWLVPIYSWRGAAWVSVISDTTLAALLWGMIYWLHRQSSSSRNGENNACTWLARFSKPFS